MTTRRTFLALVLCALALVPCGCLEVSLETRVHADGSLERSETVTGDSAEAAQFGFLSPVDSTWSVSLRRGGGNTFARVAGKRFAATETFNAALGDTAAQTLPVTAALERKFLWFYTDLEYRELYRRWNPFGVVPVSAYLPAADIARAMSESGGDSAKAAADSAAREKFSRRWTEWMYRDMFEAWYGELMRGVATLGDPRLAPQAIASRKEEIYESGRAWWASPGATDTLSRLVGAAVGNPRVERAIQANAAGFARHRERLARVARVMGKLKRVGIAMPGTLVETNAPTLDGASGVWKGVAEMSYAADYELRISSRIVNWWCVGFTGLVILAAVVMLFRARAG